jgi:hypothetical protein
MKNKLLKYYIVAFYLCSTVLSFAQTPGSDDNDTGLESADAPAAPIDDFVWVLALICLFYVFLRVRSFVKQANT